MGSNIPRLGAALDRKILRFGAALGVTQRRSTVDAELLRPSRRSPVRSIGGSKTRIDGPLTTTSAVAAISAMAASSGSCACRCSVSCATMIRRSLSRIASAHSGKHDLRPDDAGDRGAEVGRDKNPFSIHDP